MKRKKQQGIILLVVLSMLTFFSLLVAAYLVFSTEARTGAVAIANRNIKQPDPNFWIDEALMKLIRGTADGNDPFFGEDLLSDYYGRGDATSLTTSAAARIVNTSGATPTDTGFVAVPVTSTAGNFDDVFTGRILTFRSGDLNNYSFRVIRSDFVSGATRHDLIIELPEGFSASDIPSGTSIWMNGIPRNAAGIGFDGSDVDETLATAGVVQLPYTASPATNATELSNLPVALQPNHFDDGIDKSSLLATGSDFDEEYDAADFNNWFLSYRHPDGTEIPSFHRPSVINYILNSTDWSSSPNNESARNVLAAISRATFRPLPINAGQLGTITSVEQNQGFTGGNANFGLRSPFTTNGNAIARLDQLARALITGAPDVDTDGDGTKDSYWIDLGFPPFVAPEGKLLKAMVAVKIEDLGGRLNLNTVGNYALIGESTGIGYGTAASTATPITWPGTTTGVLNFPRGLGYGPAEISLPTPGTTATDNNAFASFLNHRYQVRSENSPGIDGFDPVSVLQSRWRPATFSAVVGYQRSIDPYGRGGTGINQYGSVVSFGVAQQEQDNTGTGSVTEPTTDESSDTPYESDPLSRLTGDALFTEAEFEAILRSNEFDLDVLPKRLQDALTPFVTTTNDLGRNVTVRSRSDDSPIAYASNLNAYRELVSAISNTLTEIQRKRLVAPEIRLGQKMDVNRAFGNGVDDNANSVIDDPAEIALTGFDDNGNGQIDEPNENGTVETSAFRSQGATVNSAFSSAAPDYLFGETPADPMVGWPVTPREIYARHLYVLMMVLSGDLDSNNFPTYGDTLATAVPVSDRDDYRARRIAQWAVNVVDYRDPDAIMTRFEYDPNPFDGWNPTRANTVWGCEQPELMFSETIALHDPRIRDTGLDAQGRKGPMGAGSDEDDDCDQVRIPQGSLIMELFGCREALTLPATSPLVGGIPRELYDVNVVGGNVVASLDLDKTVTTYFDDQGDMDPLNDVYGTRTTIAAQQFDVPVWRIAISEPHFEAGVVENSPLEARDDYPDTLSFEPDDLDEIDRGARQLDLERFVFFNNFTNRTNMRRSIDPLRDITSTESVFFGQAANPTLNAERYLTLAPRQTTRLGSERFGVATNPLKPSDQGFQVGTAAGEVGLQYFNANGMSQLPNTTMTIQEGANLVVAAFPPTTWGNAATTAPNGIGLNVSEPLPGLNYYPEPTQNYTNINANYPLTDAYVEFDAAGVAVAGLPADEPQDMRANRPVRDLTNEFAPGALDPMLGTVGNYRTAFLQRLADPTQGYHPQLNPYLTVDQMAIDLTIFSGEESPATVLDPGSSATATIERDYQSGTRQRDGIPMSGTGNNVLFSYSTAVPAMRTSNAAGTDYFQLQGITELSETISYLNENYGAPSGTGNYRGRPSNPFAFHPWLNRPFASSYELMVVPACSPARLFEEFSISANGSDPDILPTASTTNTTSPAYARSFVGPFRHLLNFFNSGAEDATAQSGADFGNLFSLVGTKGRYRGEVTPIAPARVNATELSEVMSAPFCMLDDSLRSGRINLNTLSGFPVWQGLMQGHLNATEYTNAAATTQFGFTEFQESRRGYALPAAAGERVDNATTGPGAINYDSTKLDARYPTQFAGVHRDFSRSEYFPQIRNIASTTQDETYQLRRRGANAGLLRGQGTLLDQDPETGSPSSVPLFVRSGTEAPTAATAPYLNRNRNPFIRYQTLMRMPNLVSDNSQVFSIRMTLGFFEVDPTNVNSIGAEYREAQGLNERFNALFIVDRAIPVGFVPGQNTNVRDTVIFERYYQ